MNVFYFLTYIPSKRRASLGLEIMKARTYKLLNLDFAQIAKDLWQLVSLKRNNQGMEWSVVEIWCTTPV